MSLKRTLAMGQVAGGNHLTADCDEPEPQHPALAQFTRWYESTGHWIYNGRAQAVWTWITRGISNMPDAPPGAAEALEQWVREDPFTAADLAEDFNKAARRHAVNDRAASALDHQMRDAGLLR